MSEIDSYLTKTATDSQREKLEHVRALVKEWVPDAEETIGYGIPVLKLNGKYLIGFAAFKNHMSIFPGAAPVADLEEKLAGFKLSKGTIQFTEDNLIPDALLKEIVELCKKTASMR